MVDTVCEMNVCGTRDKKDGKEIINDSDLPLDLELNERIEIDD